MARTRLLPAALFFWSIAAFGAEIVAVRTGRLIDPKSGGVVSGAVILIEGGRVKAVGPSVAVPAGAKVIDLSALTVLPGLFDCHTHLVGDYSTRDNNAGSLEPGKWADLIAVKGDPLQDVRVLEKVSFVMKEGTVYKDAR